MSYCSEYNKNKQWKKRKAEQKKNKVKSKKITVTEESEIPEQVKKV